jgi:hypothetical protein
MQIKPLSKISIQGVNLEFKVGGFKSEVQHLQTL